MLENHVILKEILCLKTKVYANILSRIVGQSLRHLCHWSISKRTARNYRSKYCANRLI